MKEQLIEFIEAYAAARQSGNGVLQQFAAKQIAAFLEGVEIVAKPEPAEEEQAED